MVLVLVHINIEASVRVVSTDSNNAADNFKGVSVSSCSALRVKQKQHQRHLELRPQAPGAPALWFWWFLHHSGPHTNFLL